MRARRWIGLSVAFGFAVPVLSAAATPAASTSMPPLHRFSSTGREQSYKVPRGVVMLGVEAVGGYGFPNPTTSANGVDLNVALPVIPGTALFVEVGAGAKGAAATFGGGGAAGAGHAGGGAGGGASDVRTCSMRTRRCPGGGTSTGSRLVVAGGGGGLGGDEDVHHLFGNSCGGNEQSGSAGFGTPIKVARGTVIVGQGGLSANGPAGGGTAASAGHGGFTPPCTGGGRNFGGGVAGQSGAGANGGSGGASSAPPIPGGGGGGGGGYFGGGGGSSGQADLASGLCPGGGCSASNGSGGGAGSSFYVKQATGNIFFQTGAGQQPSVKLTPLIRVTSPAPGAVFAKGRVVKALYSCLDACSGSVPVGGRINTKTAGVHSIRISDRNLSHAPAVVTVRYRIVAS